MSTTVLRSIRNSLRSAPSLKKTSSLYVFTHGSKTSCGVVIAATSELYPLHCQPLLAFGSYIDTDKYTSVTATHAGYRSIADGLATCLDLLHPLRVQRVNVIGDNYDVVFNLHWRSLELVTKEDANVYCQCQAIADSMPKVRWIHTHFRFNHAATFMSTQVDKDAKNKVINLSNYTNASCYSKDFANACLLSDFTRLYNKFQSMHLSL